MYLYICEGYKTRGTTEELVQQSLERFIKETGMDLCGRSRDILRTGKGKPYFKELPVSFSVSHTANTWVCIMDAGTDQIGVDIQNIREYNFGKIAGRYYTAAEQQYTEENGSDGFFEIWTRKEAYAKYTGMGLGSYLAEIDTLESREPVFIDLEISDSIKGACCVKEKGQLWTRRI